MSSTVSIKLLFEEPERSSDDIVDMFLETYSTRIRSIYDMCLRLNSIINVPDNHTLSKENVEIINNSADKIIQALRKIYVDFSKSWSAKSDNDIRYAFEYVRDTFTSAAIGLVVSELPPTFNAIKDEINYTCSRSIRSIINENDAAFFEKLKTAFDQFNSMLYDFINGPGLQKLEKSIEKEFRKINIDITKEIVNAEKYTLDKNYRIDKPDPRILSQINSVASTITGSTIVIDYLKKIFSSEDTKSAVFTNGVIFDKLKIELQKASKLDTKIVYHFFNLLKPNIPELFQYFLNKPAGVLKNYYMTQLKLANLSYNQNDRGSSREKIYKVVIVPIIMFFENIGELISKFESYITNIDKNIDKQKTSTTADSPLGKLAFPGARKNKSLPLEPNTNVENELFSDLKQHFEGDVMLSAEKARLVRKFLENGDYDDVFKEPTAKRVSRGMTVKRNWLETALNNQEDLKNKGSMEKSFTFTPNRGGSSWTSDSNVAKKFSSDYEGDYRVILYADVDKNPKRFISGPSGLYNIQGLDIHDHEDESIGLGPIKVSKVSWTKIGI